MSSISMPSLNHPESGFFIGRTNQLTQIQNMVNKQGICFLVPSKGIFCPIGKTALAKKYSSGQNNIVWIHAKNKETLLEELQKIQQVFTQKNSLIILDGIKEVEIIQSSIPSTHQYQILVTSRQQGLEKSAVEVVFWINSDSETALELSRRSFNNKIEKVAYFILPYTRDLTILKENTIYRTIKVGNAPT